MKATVIGIACSLAAMPANALPGDDPAVEMHLVSSNRQVAEDGTQDTTAMLEIQVAPSSSVRIDIPEAIPGGMSVVAPGIVRLAAKDGSVFHALVMDGAKTPVELDVNDGRLFVSNDSDSSEDVVVIAGNRYFHKVRKGSSKGQPRYTLYKTLYTEAIQNTLWGNAVLKNAGWNEALSHQPGLGDKHTLKQQYACHVNFAHVIGGSWNLEQYRKNLSAWEYTWKPLKTRCNW